eukprot:g43564.t1
MDQQWTTTLEQAITVKRHKLQEKLSKLVQDNNKADIWIRNLSNRKLAETEKAVLLCGLNYNHKDANRTDFMATLETTLKNRLTDETQQAIRQTNPH